MDFLDFIRLLDAEEIWLARRGKIIEAMHKRGVRLKEIGSLHEPLFRLLGLGSDDFDVDETLFWIDAQQVWWWVRNG